MLCKAMCDAGGPNQLADHHWKSGTLDSPWYSDKGCPFRNAPFGAFFINVGARPWSNYALQPWQYRQLYNCRQRNTKNARYNQMQ